MTHIPHTLSTPLDPPELRKAFGGFVTGVTVVSALDGDGVPRGLTANSFTSVSMNPPLVLVCIDKKAASHQVFSQATGYAVSILGADQRDISKLFASKAPDKFEHCATFTAVTGAPLVEGAVCWFDCEVHKSVDAGDHLLLLGEVRDFHHTTGIPLAYCRGNYIDFGLEQEAVGTGRNLVYGAIADSGGRVLLTRDSPTGRWSIPCARGGEARAVQSEHAPGGLPRTLEALGAKVALSFLYSVFDEGPDTLIVYRGIVQNETNPTATIQGAAFFSEAELPWEQLASSQVRNMLRRYFVERGNDRFGIYTEAAGCGSVAMLEGSPTPWAQHARSLDSTC
ncbi:flavin reductase [Variovorax saccharolyticus]|uniref:flavin reductase n=1 Tax=Variovorax saccharolyticus TaxID=3053516 RepID=UPI002577589B|nr:flavin reductase [Variovorax sp. J22R187]MDM0021881.1 flavin reductase [Variovorax sp. J22R187]